MKIGLVTTSYPRFEGDHAGNFVRGFARALVREGHEVEVLAPEPSEACESVADAAVRVVHVPYVRPRALQRTFYGAGAPENFSHDWRAWLGVAPFVAQLARITRERSRHWDAVVSHWALPCALIAGHLPRTLPHVAVMHSGDVHAMRRLPFADRIAHDIATHATRLWFVSHALREKFGATYGTPVIVRPMGIDEPTHLFETRERVRERLGLSRFTALTMSRLVDIKGIDVAIGALASRDDVELVVAGDGPLRCELERRARRARARVRFVGHVSGVNKEELFHAADIFLSPSRELASRSEGMPTSILESLARGVPVIASKTGGVGDVIRDGENGALVTREDSRALSNAITAFATDSHLLDRTRQAARASGARLTWAALGEPMRTLFD